MSNSKLKHTTIAMITLMAFAQCAAWADALQLTSGDRIVGIVEQDDAAKPSFVFRTVRGLLTLQRSKVAVWDRESVAAGWVRLGDDYSRINKAQEALTAYRKAAELEPNNSEATQRVWEAQTRLADVVATEQAKSGEAPEVSDTQDANQNPRQVMDLLGRARSAAQSSRYEDAAAFLDKVSPASAAGAGLDFAKGACEIYVAWGRSRADHQDVSGAVACLRKALSYVPNQPDALALLKKVMEFESGYAGEQELIYKNDMSATGRLKYGESLYKQSKYDQALNVFLDMANDPDTVTPSVRKRVIEIYDYLHEDAAERGEWQQALTIYNQMLAFDPQQPKDTLNKYEYMIRRSSVDLRDVNARVALAKFAESKGMQDVARQEFASILELQPTNEEARRSLLTYAGRDLRDAQSNLASGEHVKAKEVANRVVVDYPLFPEVVQAAQSVLLTAQGNERQHVVDTTVQAHQLLTQGDQYYNTATQILLSAGTTFRDNNNRIFSVKQESMKNMQLAINYWSQALRLDPTLAQSSKGNLRVRINDAQQRVGTLRSTAPARFPQPLDFKLMSQ